MHRERVTDDIYVFTSSLYAQVTAGAIRTEEGVIVIDTLPFPQESRQVAQFARTLHPAGIRYLILTHFHADHTNGAYLFDEARLVANQRCRELLARFGAAQLAEAKRQTPELNEVRLRLPVVLFETELTLRLGGKTLHMVSSPGHSPDVITVHIREDKILFASDTVTPIPYVVNGDIAQMRASLQAVQALSLENIVQGHGDVLLRGEISEILTRNLQYLETIQAQVQEAIRQNRGPDKLANTNVETLGISRIPLGGLTQRMHQANIHALYQALKAEPAPVAS